MKKKFDNMALGIIIGFALPLLGFWLYFALTWGQGVSLEMFLKTYTDSSVKMLAVCCTTNLAPFFIFLQTDRYRSGRGVVMATLGIALFIVYMKFIA